MSRELLAPSLLSLVGSAIVPCSGSRAAEPDGEPAALRDLVVTATGSPEPLARVLAVATVFTRERIERTTGCAICLTSNRAT